MINFHDIIVLSRNQPQFAIVSLKTLQVLEQRNQPNTLQAVKEIAQWAREHDVRAPADLSERHNEYTWGKWEGRRLSFLLVSCP